ncbi:MAG: (Fe-S)-binding protein [Methanomassiliicoccales archaeon]
MILETSKCINCGSCMRECPVVLLEGQARFSGPRTAAVDSPRFMTELGALAGDITMCTTCWRCEEVCPARIRLPEAILDIRRRIFSAGEPLQGHRRIIENVDRHRLSVEPAGEVPRGVKESGQVLYFPGCISRERVPSIYLATIGVLEKVGADFGIPYDWVCCGAPLEKIGDRERMDRLVEENRRRFEGFQKVVTSCPGCTTQMLHHYGIQPMHTIEYLYEEIGLENLPFRARKVRVALHHPCHLARTIGPHAIDYAYEILQAIPGVEVMEMEDPEVCCGGGGAVVAGHPQVALDLAREKMRNFGESGADLLLAPCPFCKLNLDRAGGEVEEFVTFLDGCMGR